MSAYVMSMEKQGSCYRISQCTFPRKWSEVSGGGVACMKSAFCTGDVTNKNFSNQHEMWTISNNF
jgi:hypothetical protein